MPTKICEVMGNGLIKWKFGVGEEGVKQLEDGNSGVVIIDDTYPCWFPAAKAVGLKVLAIWLTNGENSILSSVTDWIGNVPLTSGRVLDVKIQTALGLCDTILVGGGLPDVIVESGALRLANIVTIMAMKAFNFAMPHGWHASRHKVFHSDVGGVTDGSFEFNVYSRSVQPVVVHLKFAPRQDLRSILKMGDSGVPNSNMCVQESLEAAQTVRFCGRGIIEQRSLLPLALPDIRVRTQYKRWWVHRYLSVFERLLSMDISEKLIRSLSKDKSQAILLSSVGVPNKVLHAFLGSYQQRIIEPLQIKKRKRPKIETGDNDGDEFEPSKVKAKVGVDTARYPTSCLSERYWFPTLTPIGEEEADLIDLDISTGELESTLVAKNQKATRRDDAVATFDLWNSYLVGGISRPIPIDALQKAAEALRSWMLSLWRKRILRSYFDWRIKSDSHKLFDSAAADCIHRVANSSWWAWDQGSRPLFWKWPIDYWMKALNGVPAWFDGRVIPWIRRQRKVDDLGHVALIRQKLETIQDKGYVEDGPITSLMPFFHVAKGIDDIRMVYDGSASGLNDKLWAPWFSLPGVSSLIRSLEPGYSMSDNDIGEMFHNFMLDPELRKYCGMDVTMYSEGHLSSSVKSTKRWVRWSRLAMGLRPSPYCAVQGIMIAREVILGDQWDESNVFRWDHVRLNLPGMDVYTPTKSWFAKVRKDGTVAAEILIYVDDIRCSAPTRAEAWHAAQRTSSILASIGLQDASRKRRSPGEETGAWTGSVVWTTNGKIVVMTTQEKWDKARSQLEWLSDNINNPDGMNHKALERIRGFMVYVSQTYPSLVPYLKGLHATIDSWRYGRTVSGFKISPNNRKLSNEEEDVITWEDKLGMTKLSSNQPATVLPAPRLRDDLMCLKLLMSDAAPPHRLVRMGGQARVIYGFGDASKHGFGASIELTDKKLYWRFGQWRLEEEVSSNYRELRNLVEALEGAYEKGFLKDREIFMFTDNTTAESAFFKGMSKSELLFNLVLRLRKIEMAGQCVIHVIHVAGTRMIHQGTDGLSRGDKTSGVMAGETMLTFVPLHLTAAERSPGIITWIERICAADVGGQRPVRILTADDWVRRLGEQAYYVWMPPPAAADVAVECLAQAIHKRSNALHIFICPRLMTARWYKTLMKATDLSVTIPLGTDFWSTDQHEPLMFCVAFPLSTHRPWKHGGTPYINHIGKNLPGLFQDNLAGASALLCECFTRAFGMAAV